MAAVPITINGVICDMYGRTITGPVKIVGDAMITGLGIGGGPVIPPEGGDKPPKPPWEIWPGPGPLPHPEHPIVIPPPPLDPPMTPAEPKPPPPNGGWGWSPDYGWGYFPGPGEPTPKA